MTHFVRLSPPIVRSSLRPRSWWLLVLIAVAAMNTGVLRAQTLSTLYAFSNGDGYGPWAGLTSDGHGNFYGTTASGGSSNCGEGCGSVFKLTHKPGGWILSTLYEFEGGSDGGKPKSQVVFGPDGALYGTTQWGHGAVFSLRAPATICRAVSCRWTETVLYSFQGGNDGEKPGYGALVFDRQGNLYGTTLDGGRFGAGTVFGLTRSGGAWQKGVIYHLPGDQSIQCAPVGVAFDNSGNLWGTAFGCANTFGTVFKLTDSGSGWTATSIHVFQNTLYGSTPDGASPFASLTLGSSGTFYGTTMLGPSNPDCPDLGTVFQVNAAGEFSTLHFFPPASGPQCASLNGVMGPVAVDAQGNLYGTQYANGYGAYGGVFKGGPSGWSQLVNFSPDEGGLPIGGVLLDGGNIYGASSLNGPGGGGTIWEITP